MSETSKSKLTISMLPDGLCREIAEEIGADNLLKLSTMMGGMTFYMPRKESVLRTLRDIKIREEYNNGNNSVELSRKYNVSERWIRQIVNPNLKNGAQ